MKYFKDIDNFVKDKMVYCGIDVHQSRWNLCYFCDGEVVEKLRIHGESDLLNKHTQRLFGQAKSVKFVYEAGFSGSWLHRRLTDLGYECIITPPSRIPTTNDKVKTDKKDAEKLARYLAGGLLKKVFVLPPSVEADRQLIRLRAGYKIKMTRVKNQMTSLLHLHDLKWNPENGCRWTKRFVSWLEEVEFPEHNLRIVLNQYLIEYRSLRDQIAQITKHIRKLSRQNEYQKYFKILISCKGIGLITAITFLLELGDVLRFPSTVQFGGFLGLTPSQHTSGDKIRLGHITHEGNAHIRRVLIESAWTVIRYDPFLREKYDRIKSRGTNGKKAIVAVARSLAIRLRQCLINEEPYISGTC